MATSTTAAAPDVPTGATDPTGLLSIDGAFQENAAYIRSLSPNGSPAYDTGWVPITAFQNGWTSPANDVAVRRVGKQVFFKGTITNSTTSTTYSLAFNIPAGFRPPMTKRLAITSNSNVQFHGTANPNGDVQMYSSGTSAAWRSLDSFIWLVD